MTSNFIHSRAEREKIKEAKEEKILSFLLDENFSTSKMISKLLGVTQTTAYRTLKKMEKKNLVKMENVSVGFDDVGGKIVIWGLTLTGAFLATDVNADVFKPSNYEITRVKSRNISHSLDIQRVRLVAIQKGWTNWQSSRQVYKEASQDRAKWLQIPDAVGTSPNNQTIAFEIERTFKGLDRYETILINYAKMILNKVIVGVIYICGLKMASRLKRIFSEIKDIQVDGVEIEGVLKRFAFYEYDEWGDVS